MDHISDNIVEFYERISSWEMAVVKGTGLSLPQMHAIEVVGNSGPIRMKDLAEKLGVVMGTLTVLIKRLERDGFVERRENPEDQRSFCVDLTESGREKYEGHHKHHLLLAEEICSGLTNEEQDQFNMIIEKVLKSF